MAAAMVTALAPAGLADTGQNQAQEPVRLGPDSPMVAGTAYQGRIVVGYEPADEAILDGLTGLAGELGGELARVDKRLSFAVFELPETGQAGFLAQASNLEGVRYAEPDAEVQATFVPDDTYYSTDQWGPPAIGMEQAWDGGRGSHGVTVAVLDTGVDYTHPDLAANVCSLGKDYPNDDADPMDDHGHGTHVAGTVAAVIDNGRGVAGMANACVHPVKVLSASGGGSSADVASAIVDATDAGADVISMSLAGLPGVDWGGPTPDAVARAYAAGVLVVAAAGNDACKPVGFPAAYPEVVAVGSLDEPGDARSSFSNCGHDLEIAAPGRSILSTLPGARYGFASGTSMATPHVAGVAALVLDRHPAWTNVELRCVLRSTADDLGPAGHDVGYGFGRVDAEAAASTSSAPSACVSELSPPIEPPCPLPCLEGFEQGDTGHVRTTSLWHASTSCAVAPSGSGYLGFTRDASCTYGYASRARGFADLTVDLADLHSANLSFSHRIEEDPSSTSEGLYLTYSQDGGSSWGILEDYTDTTSTGWTTVHRDVSFLIGGTVTFRWWFDTFDGTDNDQLGWLIDDLAIDGNQRPAAAFSYDPQDPSTADEIGFTDSSTDPDGRIVHWAWTFGDATTSQEQHPSHSYADDGTYTVCLTVTDDDGAQATSCQDVQVDNTAPDASFSADPQPATNLDKTTFNDASTDSDGTVVAWRWDLGDGTSSTEPSPSHRYIDPGTYTACLRATDDDGATDTACREIEVLPVVMHGRAIGLDGTLPIGPARFADTGEVRSEEPAHARARAFALDLGPAETSGLEATVRTEIGRSEASAAVEHVVLQLAGDVVQIEGLHARAWAGCDAAAGETVLSAITVNGVPLDIPGQHVSEGLTIPLPGGGEIVLNDQEPTAEGLHVTGARLSHDSLGELRLAQASAGISSCSPGQA